MKIWFIKSCISSKNYISFHLLYRNVNPIILICRNGKFSTRHESYFQIPHSWLSSCDRIKIPHLWLRRLWGIYISSRLLSHSWGIGKYLSWLVENFQFLHARLRRLCRNYPVPEPFPNGIGSFEEIILAGNSNYLHCNDIWRIRPY